MIEAVLFDICGTQLRLKTSKTRRFLEAATRSPYEPVMRNMKPHRKIFRLAPDQGGVAADRNPFVGDRVDNYVKGRSRVGMKTVLVSRNGQRPRGRYQPDHTIRNQTEITGTLEALPPHDASGPCC